MKNMTARMVSILILAGSLFLIEGGFTSDTFKILRIKGNVSIGNTPVKPGQEYNIADIEKLSVSTPDKSGLVIVCYNNCAKNKVILEKTIDNYSDVQKRNLLETTAYKTRGGALESFPELVNYFEQKPIIIIADNDLAVNQSILGFPKEGSYLDLYYMNGFTEVVHEIPYQNNSFTFKYSMFATEEVKEAVVGPIALTMIDPNGGRETLVTEEFYVALIDEIEIEKCVTELLGMEVDKATIVDAVFEMLSSQYPDYYLDKAFVKQYVEQK